MFFLNHFQSPLLQIYCMWERVKWCQSGVSLRAQLIYEADTFGAWEILDTVCIHNFARAFTIRSCDLKPEADVKRLLASRDLMRRTEVRKLLDATQMYFFLYVTFGTHSI